jgi:hypothetical protein
MRVLILVLVACAGYGVGMGLLPWWLPPPPDLPNVASLLGYNTSVAYAAVLGWTVVVALLALLFWPVPEAEKAHPVRRPVPARLWTERGIVALGVFALYWPTALARFGDHIEDSYFLAALWRMDCGLRPYADFEFLYGPLMLWPARWLQEVTGFSMASYYAVYAASQLVVILGVVVLLQRHIPHGGRRFLAFLALLPFALDILLGLNWIALRYGLVVPVILIVAADPRAWRAAVAAGLLIAVMFGYSWEYALAALFAGLGIQVAALLNARAGTDRMAGLRGGLLSAVVLMAVSLGAGAAVLAVTSGVGLGGYLASVAQVAAFAADRGLGQFAFYWTPHAAALFVIFAVVVLALGGGVRRIGSVQAMAGDYDLVGGAVFAAAVLKIGLQRADYLHMAVPFVPLIVMLLIARPRRLTVMTRPVGRFVGMAIAVAAIAQSVGNFPLGRWVIPSSLRGLVHVVEGRPTVGPIAARGYSIETERSKVEGDVALLAARLAEPDLAPAPVLFYSSLWDMPHHVGVCPTGHAFYDLLYSNDVAPLSDAVDRPGQLVVIDTADLKQLQSGVAPTPEPRLSAVQRFASRIASAHPAQSQLETRYEYAMWKAALGYRLLTDFQEIDRVGTFVILRRTQ